MPKSTYNTTYIPPVPALGITLCLPSADTSVGPFPAIVDSGADATLIPTIYLRQLGARSWDEAYLRSQWGERRHIYTYLIDVRIGEQILPGIEVVGDDLGQEIVMGRNLLNRPIVLLDGPEETLYVLLQRPRRLRF